MCRSRAGIDRAFAAVAGRSHFFQTTATFVTCASLIFGRLICRLGIGGRLIACGFLRGTCIRTCIHWGFFGSRLFGTFALYTLFVFADEAFGTDIITGATFGIVRCTVANALSHNLADKTAGAGCGVLTTTGTEFVGAAGDRQALTGSTVVTLPGLCAIFDTNVENRRTGQTFATKLSLAAGLSGTTVSTTLFHTNAVFADIGDAGFARRTGSRFAPGTSSKALNHFVAGAAGTTSSVAVASTDVDAKTEALTATFTLLATSTGFQTDRGTTERVGVTDKTGVAASATDTGLSSRTRRETTVLNTTAASVAFFAIQASRTGDVRSADFTGLSAIWTLAVVAGTLVTSRAIAVFGAGITTDFVFGLAELETGCNLSTFEAFGAEIRTVTGLETTTTTTIGGVTVPIFATITGGCTGLTEAFFTIRQLDVTDTFVTKLAFGAIGVSLTDDGRAGDGVLYTVAFQTGTLGTGRTHGTTSRTIAGLLTAEASADFDTSTASTIRIAFADLAVFGCSGDGFGRTFARRTRATSSTVGVGFAGGELCKESINPRNVGICTERISRTDAIERRTVRGHTKHCHDTIDAVKRGATGVTLTDRGVFVFVSKGVVFGLIGSRISIHCDDGDTGGVFARGRSLSAAGEATIAHEEDLAAFPGRVHFRTQKRHRSNAEERLFQNDHSDVICNRRILLAFVTGVHLGFGQIDSHIRFVIAAVVAGDVKAHFNQLAFGFVVERFHTMSSGQKEARCDQCTGAERSLVSGQSTGCRISVVCFSVDDCAADFAIFFLSVLKSAVGIVRLLFGKPTGGDQKSPGQQSKAQQGQRTDESTHDSVVSYIKWLNERSETCRSEGHWSHKEKCVHLQRMNGSSNQGRSCNRERQAGQAVPLSLSHGSEGSINRQM